MQHVLYKTTNLLNGRFYVGMHSTNNPNDGYLGSGRRLRAEIKKYGRENFKREILEVLTSRDALKAREEEIVNETLLDDCLCLNLKNGGEGGGRVWHAQHAKIFHSAGQRAMMAKVHADADKVKQISQKVATTIKTRHAEGAYPDSYGKFLGKSHTDDTRQKMADSHRGKHEGEKNSQFGTCWVSDGAKPIKIRKDELQEYLDRGFVRGRK